MMNLNKAKEIEKAFEAYSRTGNKALIIPYGLKELHWTAKYLHAKYGKTHGYEKIKERMAVLGKERKWHSHPMAIFVFYAALILFAIIAVRIVFVIFLGS